jgi:hypothetical protein
MTPVRNSIVVQAISSTFIFLFVYTAVSKLYDIRLFQSIIGQAPIIGEWKIFISWAVPITELLISVLLFVPTSRSVGLKASFGLMTLFTLYVLLLLLFSPTLPCSCGGVISDMSWSQHLVFNLLLTLLAFAGIRFDRTYKYLKKESPGVILT